MERIDGAGVALDADRPVASLLLRASAGRVDLKDDEEGYSVTLGGVGGVKNSLLGNGDNRSSSTAEG